MVPQIKNKRLVFCCLLFAQSYAVVANTARPGCVYYTILLHSLLCQIQNKIDRTCMEPSLRYSLGFCEGLM